MLNNYLSHLIALEPQPLEIAIFFEVEINIAGLRLKYVYDISITTEYHSHHRLNHCHYYQHSQHSSPLL